MMHTCTLRVIPPWHTLRMACDGIDTQARLVCANMRVLTFWSNMHIGSADSTLLQQVFARSALPSHACPPTSRRSDVVDSAARSFAIRKDAVARVDSDHSGRSGGSSRKTFLSSCRAALASQDRVPARRLRKRAGASVPAKRRRTVLRGLLEILASQENGSSDDPSRRAERRADHDGPAEAKCCRQSRGGPARSRARVFCATRSASGSIARFTPATRHCRWSGEGGQRLQSERRTGRSATTRLRRRVRWLCSSSSTPSSSRRV